MSKKGASHNCEIKKPDSQGRIAIGKEYSNDMYSVEPQSGGGIFLRPVVIMDKREVWLFNNQDALASVKRGMEQSDAGDVHDLGSFQEFLEAQEEDQ